MRRALFIAFTGVLVGGCGATDMTRPPTEASRVANLGVSSSDASVTSRRATEAILDDVIERLAPALGARGIALGAPLRRVREGGRLDAALIDATQRQLAAFQSSLPSESTPDADALEFALAALRASADK